MLRRGPEKKIGGEELIEPSTLRMNKKTVIQFFGNGDRSVGYGIEKRVTEKINEKGTKEITESEHHFKVPPDGGGKKKYISWGEYQDAMESLEDGKEENVE